MTEKQKEVKDNYMIYLDMYATSKFEYNMDERFGDYFHLQHTYKTKNTVFIV